MTYKLKRLRCSRPSLGTKYLYKDKLANAGPSTALGQDTRTLFTKIVLVLTSGVLRPVIQSKQVRRKPYSAPVLT